jgi:ATPase subunit of ABC transporter with duplicated ATPase domains
VGGYSRSWGFRDLVEKGHWDSGPLRVGTSMRVGYVAQDRDGLRRGWSIRVEFEALGLREASIRSLQHGFGFDSDAPDRDIEKLYEAWV